MSTSRGARYATVFALWLSSSLCVSYLFALIYGGHGGAVVVLIFAIPVAVCGALASCASLASVRLRSLSSSLRIALVAALAIAPVALLSFGAVLTLPEYKAVEALRFTAPFAVCAPFLSALCDRLILRRAFASTSSAT